MTQIFLAEHSDSMWLITKFRREVMEDKVTISRYDYELLLKYEEFLNCLEACGVDNWIGYHDACEMMEEDE